MFVASAPLWWAFEGINQLTDNWHYLGVSHYSSLQYGLLATWNFSIVIPGVFETAELLSAFGVVRRFRQGVAGGWCKGHQLQALQRRFWPRHVFS